MKKQSSSITAVKVASQKGGGPTLSSLNVEEFVSSITYRLEALRCLALCAGLASIEESEEVPREYLAWAGKGLAFALDDFNARMRGVFEVLKEEGDGKGHLFSSFREQRMGGVEEEESAAGD